MAEYSGIRWHIVQGGQRQTTQISPAGNGFQDVYEITYMIDTGPARGIEGVIRVPVTQFDPEVIKAMINALVAQHHAVASL